MPIAYTTFMKRRAYKRLTVLLRESLQHRLKFNPNHDDQGRFAEGPGSASARNSAGTLVSLAAIRNEVAFAVDRGRALFGDKLHGIYLVGSWAVQDPARQPDRQGSGTSDIDLLFDVGNDRDWGAAAQFERESMAKFGRHLHINLEKPIGNAIFIRLWPAGAEKQAKWSEADHPREPAGSSTGGQFTDGGSGDVSSGSDTPVEDLSTYEALYDYQNYAYGKINQQLRDGAELDEKGKQYVAAIDKAFNETVASSGKVFRGDGAGLSAVLFEAYPLSDDFKASLTDFATSQRDVLATKVQLLNTTYAGKIFQDKAYVSTSSSQRLVMDKFVGGSLDIKKYGGVGLVEITGKVKKIDMDAATRRTTAEKERLLPRGTAFRVESVDLKPHPDGERIYLHWKVKVVA